MTNIKHDYPLKSGEVREHTTVSGETFKVYHVSNGSFTQVRGPQGVICTEVLESTALRAYAEAIEQAETDEIGVDDVVVRRGEEDGPRGVVHEVHEVPTIGSDRPNRFVLVSFAGLRPIAMDAHRLTLAPGTSEQTVDTLTAQELAAPLWDAVRRHVPGGGAQLLHALRDRAAEGSAFREEVKLLTDLAESVMESGAEYDRQFLLENLIAGLRKALAGQSWPPRW